MKRLLIFFAAAALTVACASPEKMAKMADNVKVTCNPAVLEVINGTIDPVVTVKLMNFKVCVLGDVVRPGQLVVAGERLTIFEALSMVGDLTIYGQRHNVTIIREENGLRTIGEIDLSSQTVFDSPYYYLHQNDVIYVEPNMRKKRNADRDPMIMTYISSAISIVSVLSSMFYYYILSQRFLK